MRSCSSVNMGGDAVNIRIDQIKPRTIHRTCVGEAHVPLASSHASQVQEEQIVEARGQPGTQDSLHLSGSSSPAPIGAHHHAIRTSITCLITCARKTHTDRLPCPHLDHVDMGSGGHSVGSPKGKAKRTTPRPRLPGSEMARVAIDSRESAPTGKLGAS